MPLRVLQKDGGDAVHMRASAPALGALLLLILLTLLHVTTAAGESEKASKRKRTQGGGIPSTGVWRTPGGSTSSSLEELSGDPPEGMDPKEWERTVMQMRAQLGKAAPGSKEEL